MKKQRTAERTQTERPAKRWARRSATVPLYGLAAIVCWTGLPLFLTLAALADGVSGVLGGRARWSRSRAVLFFALYLAAEVIGIIAAGLIYVCLLGGRVGGPARYVRVNAALQRHWTSAIFSGAFRIFGMTLHVEGADQIVPGPLLVFVRHSSVADTLLTAAVVGNPHRLLLRYVVKQELLWDPCIDIVGARLPNAFVDRDAPKSEAKLAALAELAEGLDAKSGALIYPEGTRFSASKLARGLERLRQRGSTSLLERAEGFRHVLPPRVGGVLTLLDAAPNCDVLFVEHFGFEGVRSFADFWKGGLVGRPIHVRLRRVAACDIPATERAEWLYEQWATVDEWIHTSTAACAPGSDEPHEGSRPELSGNPL